jgi:uncharacterized protein
MAHVELHIEVVCSPKAGCLSEVSLSLPLGSSVRDALQQACPDLMLDGLAVGVWGKLREPGDLLRDRDRVEIYRPLQVDPKEARRQRYQSHRAKAKPQR